VTDHVAGNHRKVMRFRYFFEVTNIALLSDTESKLQCNNTAGTPDTLRSNKTYLEFAIHQKGLAFHSLIFFTEVISSFDTCRTN